MATTKLISTVVQDVVRQFKEVLNRDTRLDQNDAIQSIQWQSEYDRFRLWATNLGAHQLGKSSLDSRLRDASHIKKQVLSLLESLQIDLGDLLDMLNGELRNVGISQNHNYDHSDEEDGRETEVEQIFRIVSGTLRSLLRLSMLIRRSPAQYDRIKQSQDISAFLMFDISHVQNKFPDINPKVAERLGYANGRRRAVRKYREKHHMKLKHGLDGQSVAPSSTQPTDMPDPVDNASLDADNQSSMPSESSFALSLYDNSKGVRVPRPTGLLGEEPFECDHCRLIIDIQNRHQWTSHVFKDLEAYQCIVVDCASPHRLYGNRNEWFSHFVSEHENEVSEAMKRCPVCGGSGFDTRAHLKRHLSRHLQELALFTVPPECYEEDTDEASGSEADSNGSLIEDTRLDTEVQTLELLDNPPGNQTSEGEDEIERPGLGRDWTLPYNPPHSPSSSDNEKARLSLPLTGERQTSEPTSTVEDVSPTNKGFEKRLRSSQSKLRERFMRAGYTSDHIDAILDSYKRGGEQGVLNDAIDLRRPSYIRLQRKHMYPETLDYYGLPWEYDSTDNRYIIIKRYISHDFQQELFRHTVNIRIRNREEQPSPGVEEETYFQEEEAEEIVGRERISSQEEDPKRKTKEEDDELKREKRFLAEGALAGGGAAELLRSKRRASASREGENPQEHFGGQTLSGNRTKCSRCRTLNLQCDLAETCGECTKVGHVCGPKSTPTEDSRIPPNARWTKIKRPLISPQALKEAGERFEERDDAVIVLRVLTKEEIQKLADRTQVIRRLRTTPHSTDNIREQEKINTEVDGADAEDDSLPPEDTPEEAQAQEL